MITLNFRLKFRVGSIIEVRKPYVNGTVSLPIGTQGIVKKITIESFPDMGLFDLKIVHMMFGKQGVSMEESIAKEFFNIVQG